MVTTTPWSRASSVRSKMSWSMSGTITPATTLARRCSSSSRCSIIGSGCIRRSAMSARCSSKPTTLTPSKGDRVVGFELHRADIAERLMQPLPIIEHLDELEHLRASVVAGVIVPLMDQLIFERTEEALDHGVVVTIPLATHAGHKASLLYQPLIRDTGVQRPLIGVMNQARRRLPPLDGHPERPHGDLFVWRGTHRPADDPPRVQIEEHGQVQPARAGGNGREITSPDPIRRGRHEDLLQAVRGRRGELMLFEHRAEPAHTPGHHSMEAAQPRHPMAAARHAQRRQRPPELHCPVPLLGLRVQLAHPFHQRAIRLRATTVGPAAPGIVATAAHLQDRTHAANRELRHMLPDKGISQSDPRAKNAAAFLKMSRSSRRRAFSRRRRESSSVLWARPPLPGNDASPKVSTSCCHLYRWFRRKPSSRATAAAGRPEDFQSRRASSLNSLVNRCRFAIGHLLGAIVPFLRCPRKWG